VSSQQQKATENAIAVQSGRDTVIQQGLTPCQMREVLDSLAGQLTAYTAVARQVVDTRLAEFEERILERFAPAAAKQRQLFADPDFQYAITRAQHAYARSGDKELLETLVDIINERSKQTQRTRLTLTLNASLETVADLTPNEFAELSLVFILRYSRNSGVRNLPTFAYYFDHQIRPFLSLVSREFSSYQYLEAKQCASIEMGQLHLHDIIRRTYAGVFQRGFTIDELKNSVPEDQREALNNHPLLVPCLNDASKLQFDAVNGDDLLGKLRQAEIPETTASNLVNFSEGRAWAGQELWGKIEELVPDFQTVRGLWDNTPLKSLKLTSLGIAIGYCNARRNIASWAGELSTWIK
jgi:hypothetical protein